VANDANGPVDRMLSEDHRGKGVEAEMLTGESSNTFKVASKTPKDHLGGIQLQKNSSRS